MDTFVPLVRYLIIHLTLTNTLAGSTEPFFCTFPFLCPEGTEDTTRILLIPIVVIITLVLLLIQYLNEYIDKKRATVHQQEAGLLKASRITALEQKKNNNSLEITFENLDLILPTGLKILDNVSGVFKKGRMCAIMGPSGSGKTTLLSVLMGTAKKTSGRLLINDIAGDLSTHKRMVGYVPQEDIMLRELSVRQILLHSGSMRLPKSWPERKVKEKVLETIVALDLGHVIDSAIGNEEHRGISGGQRKRYVKNGVELMNVEANINGKVSTLEWN